MDDPVYPDRVRFIRKGKDAGSLMTIVYTKLSVSVPPPAVAPVAVTVKVCDPVTLVEPLISPVAELIESPGGRPVATKVPLPENPTV